MNLINALLGVLFAGIDGHVGATLVIALAAKGVPQGTPLRLVPRIKGS